MGVAGYSLEPFGAYDVEFREVGCAGNKHIPVDCSPVEFGRLMY